jgi:hypothetical protein
MSPRRGSTPRRTDWLTDWPSVAMWLWLSEADTDVSYESAVFNFKGTTSKTGAAGSYIKLVYVKLHDVATWKTYQNCNGPTHSRTALKRKQQIPPKLSYLPNYAASHSSWP